ncbi:MAG: L,D-transpeptidase [Lactobacillales bacterium]|jgi:lipoprotein-anchoring transpeptidase ErfK/SrfK|nr:L,D-transpeptidase [Lactobacillales bacterium]
MKESLDMKKKEVVAIIIAVIVVVCVFAIGAVNKFLIESDKESQAVVHEQHKAAKKSSTSSSSKEQTDAASEDSTDTTKLPETAAPDSGMLDSLRAADPEYWKKKTDTKNPYPDLKKYNVVEITVNTALQQMTITGDGQLLQTMLCSTGDATPLGDFAIENEQGASFYASAAGEGGNYWVSFKGHGLYTIHSTPTDKAGNFIESEGQLLGTKHTKGSIHLSQEDAKWLYENVTIGTVVHIV